MIGCAIATAVAVLVLGSVTWWLRQHRRIVTVTGDSMRPTLAAGDRLLVRRTSLPRVKVGDIAVLTAKEFPDADMLATDMLPTDIEHWVIKRVVATAGDPVPASVAPVMAVQPGTPLPDGALAVIGDNVDASHDSRVFGYVSADQVFGVVVRRIGSTRRHDLHPAAGRPAGEPRSSGVA